MTRLLLVALFLGLTSAQDCGIKPGNFHIIGGDDASQNEWPWQLSFQTNGGFHFCGATLINEFFAVTAAHCAEGENPGTSQLIAGDHGVLDDDDGDPTQARSVEFLAIHPEYNFPDNDVAVLRVGEAFDLNDAVHPACPPDSGRDYSDGATNDCWISGWGDDGSGSPNILQEVAIDLMTDDECQEEWPGFEAVYCIQGRGSDQGNVGACFGDSGGPISCLRDDTGTWDVVGAASFVGGQCNTNLPTGYAKLPELWDFVEGTIEDNPPQN